MTTELDILEAVRRALDALGHGELAQTHQWVPTIYRDAGEFTITCDCPPHGYFYRGNLRAFETGDERGITVADWVKAVLVGMGLA